VKDEKIERKAILLSPGVSHEMRDEYGVAVRTIMLPVDAAHVQDYLAKLISTIAAGSRLPEYLETANRPVAYQRPYLQS